MRPGRDRVLAAAFGQLHQRPEVGGAGEREGGVRVDASAVGVRREDGVGERRLPLEAEQVAEVGVRAAGVRDITVVDLHEIRLKKALELGAARVVNAQEVDPVQAVSSLNDGYGPEFVFETAGNRVTASQTVDMAQRGGTIMMVGNVVGQTPFNFQRFTNKELQVRSIFRYRNIFPTAIAAVASGQIDITHIVSSVFPFEEAQQAFEDSISQQQTMVKAVIKIAQP